LWKAAPDPFGGSEINYFDPGGVFRDLFPKGLDQAPMEADSSSQGGDYAVKWERRGL
jgi:hypothetical protein